MLYPVPPGLEAGKMATISACAQEAYARCRTRYPTIDFSIEDYLARAQASGVEFEHLCHEDLFLASACARGDRIAWEYFADDYMPLLHRLAARACRQFQESEDLAQDIAAGLIADKSKLAAYSGRGSLAGWLRVAIAHAAIDRFRKRRREIPLEGTEAQDPPAAKNAGISRCDADHTDARWGPVLAQVLQRQIRILPARDRLILALYYLQSVPLKYIGRHFGVHEATASRWLEGLRREIRRRVERELRVSHGLRPGEIRSLWSWVAEREELSLDKILVAGREEAESAGIECASQNPGAGIRRVKQGPL